MRYLKQAILFLPLLIATHTYADEFISIPSTLFYNKLRFGMTPEMVGKALDSKRNKLGCGQLSRDDIYFQSDLEQKICMQYIYDENGDDIKYKLYFTNSKLTTIFSFFKPVDKNADLDSYFNKKVDTLRDVMKQANIKCDKKINNSKRCSFHSSIASIDFTQIVSGAMISLRPPSLLAEEYERKEANGPVDISLYGLEVGKSNLADLKTAAMKNNWKMTKEDGFLRFNKPNQATYIITPQDPTDVHTLLADFDGDTLSEFTYWFVDPFETAAGKPIKVNIDYLKLLKSKYGTPYREPSDTFRTTEWRVNKGYRNEVEIRTDQSVNQELKFISYSYVRLELRREIKRINKSIEDLMKRFYGSKIDL